MLYPQNGDRIVVIDSVTSLSPYLYHSGCIVTSLPVCARSGIQVCVGQDNIRAAHLLGMDRAPVSLFITHFTLVDNFHHRYRYATPTAPSYISFGTRNPEDI